jgi:hypothetical protein
MLEYDGVPDSQNTCFRPSLPIEMVPWVLRWERQKRCSNKKKARAHGREMLL